MSKIIQFGEDVEGFTIPVLNEREIRAAAGLLFVGMFLSLMFVLFRGDFLPIKYFLIVFLSDLLLRVVVNPRFAPSLIVGRWIVRDQVPEYVGAPQKKFAWIIGVGLCLAMVIHIIVVNAFSPISGITCLICLLFLFFESAFGICLGCKFFPIFFKEKVQYCPGEVCDVRTRQEIQKTSKAQGFVLLAFAAYIVIAALLFHQELSKKPFDLFGITTPAAQIR